MVNQAHLVIWPRSVGLLVVTGWRRTGLELALFLVGNVAEVTHYECLCIISL